MKMQLRPGIKIGSWTLRERLGSGGNGQVWRSENSAGQEVALKVITKMKAIARKRFKDEIMIMRSCDVEGVIPLIDVATFEPESDDLAWYAMPVGTPISKSRVKVGPAELASAFIRLAKTLASLHLKEISHRDIKPANIIIIGEDPFLGDFGLVDFPNKDELTGVREQIGPKWTMAPEIRRIEQDTDLRPADVYALAKSFWILLTGIKDGFEGRYDRSARVSITQYCGDEFVDSLEQLLADATDHDPARRPGANEFSERLQDWLETTRSFKKRNPLEWKYAQLKLFPLSAPRRAEWIDLEEMVRVLKVLGHKTNLNHLFFPSGGGLDLNDARLSDIEPGCIELVANGLTSLCRPRMLTFEGFIEDPAWSYLRLDCRELRPSGVYDLHDDFRDEEVTDLGGGNYVERSYWDEGEYAGEGLPGCARVLTRYSRGAFLLVQKTSVYNKIGSTYDARHNKMTRDTFREYMDGLYRVACSREI
jgi:serine/threonine-protein kinase